MRRHLISLFDERDLPYRVIRAPGSSCQSTTQYDYDGNGDLANAGIYVLEPEVLTWVPAKQKYDFGHDVFPRMLAAGVKIAGYEIKDVLIDIGLPETYEQANRLASTKYD